MPTTVTAIKTVRIGGNYTKAQLSVSNWNGTGAPLVLSQGQFAIEKDTLKGKWGDGSTVYSALGYIFFEGEPGGQTVVPITTNPQTYTYTGALAYPPFRFFIKAGTNVKPWYPDYDYDQSTKILTVALEPTDGYVLVIG